MELEDLARQCERAINAAGPRFTPGIDADAPNIQVAHLVDAVDALALRDGFRERVREHESRLADVARRTRYTMDELFKRRTVTPSVIADDLSQIRSLVSPAEVRRQVLRIRRRCRLVATALDEERDALHRSLSQPAQGDRPTRDRLESRRREVGEVARELDTASGYLTTAPGRLLADQQALLILGSWGTGKTHFVCDVARSALADGSPALLTLAHLLERDTDPLDALAAWSGLALDGATLLQELDALGAKTGRRSLVLFDAINEGDREVWRRSVARVVRRVRDYQHVGLVLTCRTPFDRTIFDDGSRALFVITEHVGFEDQEFDAQLEFFDYYSIPAPHVPLISPEFSRPLFLKILCEAIARLASRSRGAKLREIASGQKGMNHVLEYFVKKVGADIEDDFGLAKKSCWTILKGTPNTGFTGIAGRMADESRDWVAPSEVTTDIQAHTGLSAEKIRELLARFVTDGLLAESAIYEGAGWREVLIFPYQRFGDHLIARHLLDRHLDTSSEESVRRCFYANQPLGKIFVLDQWKREFQEPGIAAAIMLEFPERMKRTELGRELVWYLPKARQLVLPVKDALLEGLYWRSADSFTEETDRLVAFLLQFDNRDVQFETLEVLTALAARHEHPYNAKMLSGYLAPMDMPERDLIWTEYVRTSGELGALRRVLAWIERRDHARTPGDLAANDIELLSLGLTTTDRLLRDQLTKAIFEIGLRHPKILFEDALVSLAFSDPYVPERMLAAAYGVAMRLWADPSGDALRSAIVPFARQLVREMFLRDAPHGTFHTLTRGYALGVIELSRQISRHAVATQWVQYVRLPMSQLASPFLEPGEISDAEIAGAERALRMDFENYTIGSLIPDRANYQMDPPEYATVRRQILARIRALGYDPALFDTIDTRIAQYTWQANDSGKTDRYGKKYSWIAYFEMYGWREDRGELPERRQGERTPDCDVDPSFPSQANRWEPALPHLFSDATEAPVDWLREGPTPDYGNLFRRDVVDDQRGPWVLLEGYVNQADGSLRAVFTFLRSVLIDESDLADLRQFITQESYLGNSKIPEPPSDFYTYLGEIPWSQRYGSDLRNAKGATRQQFDYAFPRFKGGSWMTGIGVEVPVRRWAWESYHTQLVRTGSVNFPAPGLCEDLGLVNHNDSLDLYDAQGRLATVYREWPDERGGSFGSNVLYIREDLIARYLELTRQRLVWVPWGERTLNYKRFEQDLGPDVQQAFSQNRNDFGKLVLCGLGGSGG